MVGLGMVWEGLVLSGCAQADAPDQASRRSWPQDAAASGPPLAEKGSLPPPVAVSPRKVSAPESASPSDQAAQQQNPSGPMPGEQAARLGSQDKKPTEKTQAKNTSKPSKPSVPPEQSVPVGGKTSSAGKPSGLEEKPKPIYGLPLEYHFDLPEVPERIRGPTPMPVVSKPGLPGPVPKRE